MDSDQLTETVEIHLQGSPQEVGNMAAILKEHLEVVQEMPEEASETKDSVRRTLIKLWHQSTYTIPSTKGTPETLISG